jgi:hypothetical protein
VPSRAGIIIIAAVAMACAGGAAFGQNMEVDVAGKDPILSAEIVLKPQSGKSLKGAAITAETVKDYAPAAEAVREAKRYFTQAGFKLGDLSGVSITISAPKSVFERVFGARIEVDHAGSAVVQGQTVRELPLSRLPPLLRRAVEAVTFGRPPDFGPTGSYFAG